MSNQQPTEITGISAGLASVERAIEQAVDSVKELSRRLAPVLADQNPRTGGPQECGSAECSHHLSLEEVRSRVSSEITNMIRDLIERLQM